MALKLQSADLHRILADASLGPNEIHQAYNALDSAVTLRVHSRLSALLAQSPPRLDLLLLRPRHARPRDGYDEPRRRHSTKGPRR